MKWFIGALVTFTSTGERDLKFHQHLSFDSYEKCNTFHKSFEDNLQKGLVTVYPDVTFKRIECMDMDTMLMVQMDIMKRRKNVVQKK